MTTQYASAFTSAPEKLVHDTFFSINDTYQKVIKAHGEWMQAALTVGHGHYDQASLEYQEYEQAAQRLNDAQQRHHQACVNTVNNAIQQGDAQTLWSAITYALSNSFKTTNGDTNTSTLIDHANWESMMLVGTASTTVTRSAAQHPRWLTARSTIRVRRSTASSNSSAKKAKHSQQ